jgi:flagellar motor switch protein FliM
MVIDGLEGEALFQYERSMMFMLVDGFLGGDSKPNAKTSMEITEFEEKIIKKISERILRHFEKACLKNAKVTGDIREVITRTDNFEISNPEDLMTTIKVDFVYGGITSVFSMAFPSYIMEPMLKKPPKKAGVTDKKTTGTAAMQPYKYEKMKDVKIDCAVVLSGLKIKLRDIIDVQVGDCIKLEQDIYKPLEIKFGGITKFKGVPGLRGRKMAVRVTGIFKGGTNGRD